MKPPSVTDLVSLPLILTLTEMAALYRIGVSTLRRGVQNGTFSPRPWDRYPYRWRREDVLADMRRARPERPHQPHGFAATRRRQAKAPLDSPRSKRSAS